MELPAKVWAQVCGKTKKWYDPAKCPGWELGHLISGSSSATHWLCDFRKVTSPFCASSSIQERRGWLNQIIIMGTIYLVLTTTQVLFQRPYMYELNSGNKSTSSFPFYR